MRDAAAARRRLQADGVIVDAALAAETPKDPASGEAAIATVTTNLILVGWAWAWEGWLPAPGAGQGEGRALPGRRRHASRVAAAWHRPLQSHTPPTLVLPACFWPQVPQALTAAFSTTGAGNLLEAPGASVQVEGQPTQTTIEVPVGTATW